jgi:hypothetical protein
VKNEVADLKDSCLEMDYQEWLMERHQFLTLNKTNQFMPPETTSNGYATTGTAQQKEPHPRPYYGDQAPVPALHSLCSRTSFDH